MDGALVYACDPDAPGTAWLKRRKLPLVLVDQEPDPELPSINIDDRDGARQAAQHLVDLGHRRIGILNMSAVGPVGLVPEPFDLRTGYVSGQRLQGWLDALTPAGVTPTVVHQRTYVREPDEDGARLLLGTDPRPTAVLTFSDALAETVVRVARDLGLRVPEDVSVVGFDDAPRARLMSPPLTTIRQDIPAKGHAAAAALTALIEASAGHGTAAPRPADVLMPVELVVRGSTAPPPATGD
jgi:DNA-binding LacI/PurR family transcriptional regulator